MPGITVSVTGWTEDVTASGTQYGLVRASEGETTWALLALTIIIRAGRHQHSPSFISPNTSLG